MPSNCNSSESDEWDEKNSPEAVSSRRLSKCSSFMSEQSSESDDKPAANKQQSSLFIHKLFEMATCDSHAHIFGFSEDGLSLKIRNAAALGPVLLRYFKHSNTSSFIRQLNNYGFKTISSVSNGNNVQTFAHPYFHREGKDMLDTITRKTAKNVKKCKGEIIKELQHVEAEYRKRFRDMESRNQQLERKNEHLECDNKKLKFLFDEAERRVQSLENRLTQMCFDKQRSLMPPLFPANCLVDPGLPGLELGSHASDVSSRLSEDFSDAYDIIDPRVVDEDILESLMDANDFCGNLMVV